MCKVTQDGQVAWLQAHFREHSSRESQETTVDSSVAVGPHPRKWSSSFGFQPGSCVTETFGPLDWNLRSVVEPWGVLLSFFFFFFFISLNVTLMHSQNGDQVI